MLQRIAQWTKRFELKGLIRVNMQDLHHQKQEINTILKSAFTHFLSTFLLVVNTSKLSQTTLKNPP